VYVKYMCIKIYTYIYIYMWSQKTFAIFVHYLCTSCDMAEPTNRGPVTHGTVQKQTLDFFGPLKKIDGTEWPHDRPKPTMDFQSLNLLHLPKNVKVNGINMISIYNKNHSNNHFYNLHNPSIWMKSIHRQTPNSWKLWCHAIILPDQYSRIS